MAYIGYKKAASSTVVSKTLATMTGDGTDTTLTLLATPGSVNNVSVFLDGVFQTPGVHFTLAGNVITFTTAPASNVVVIALTGGGEHIGSPMAGSIKSDDLGVGAVTSSKIASMDAAKVTGTYPALDASAVTGLTSANLTGTFGALNASAVTGLTSANLTGTLPAISGAALTNVPSPFTESASDPATNTNPSGGLGTIWVNTTSGEMYACTDATADANVWKNIGAGTGNVVPHSFNDGGSSYGYFAGGYSTYAQVPTNINVIDQFSFTTDGNATDIADLTKGRSSIAGASSLTHGYAAGGYGGVNGTGPGSWNVVDRIAFASVADATDVGDIDYSNGNAVGSIVGTTNGDKAYFSNNMTVANGGSHGLTTCVFSKYTMSSNITASVDLDLGSCHPTPIAMSSNSLATSDTHCYSVGGYTTTYFDGISKMSYATEGNATDVGDCTVGSASSSHECTQTTTYGYKFGAGTGGPANIQDNPVIAKWSFASGTQDAVQIGTLLAVDGGVAGYMTTNAYSSTTHGYTAGGGGYNKTHMIAKMSYATEATMVDIGDLTIGPAHGQGGYGSGTEGKRGGAAMQV